MARFSENTFNLIKSNAFMHIPDGWLSISVLMFTWGITFIGVSFSVAKIGNKNLDKTANIGVVAAIIFVAQLFNFPIFGGVSGHLLGSTLAVCLVGLSGAIIALFAVLFLQAIVFADGGILALGANTFNLAIIGGLSAVVILKLTQKLFKNPSNLSEGEARGSYDKKENPIKFELGFYASAFFAAFFSVLISSFFAALEIWFSAPGQEISFSLIVGLTLFYHTFIGIGEGVITAFVLFYLQKAEFPLLAKADKEETTHSFLETIQKTSKPVLGLGILFLLFTILSFYSSSNLDGLQKVGEQFDLGVGNTFMLGITNNYVFLGNHSFLGIVLSTILGVTFLIGIIGFPLFWIRKKQYSTANNKSPPLNTN